jgi:hypothetical protein
MGIACSCFKKGKTVDRASLSIATIADNATFSTAIQSHTTDASPFRLLELPVEVVAHVTSFISSETLIPVRLTCKALQHFTFDRFANENFAHVYCWVATLDDFTRLKDILHQSPRLSSRIRRLTLTTNALKDQSESAIHYVRQESANEDTVRADAIKFFKLAEDPSYFATLRILRTLQDIQRLPQDIFVAADLPTTRMVRNDREHISVIWYDTVFACYRWQKDLKSTQSVLVHRILFDLYTRSCLTTFSPSYAQQQVSVTYR